MFCAVSGEPAIHPVVSVKSGAVFERTLIEKIIREDGKDPISGDELAVSDLIEVKVPKIAKPRTPTATSIPSLLSIFQNEWDALMLETFTLKQQLEKTRQELSHALYQHDAACRIIARLVKERDAARHALANVQANIGYLQQEAASASATATAGATADGSAEPSETAASTAAAASSTSMEVDAPASESAAAPQEAEETVTLPAEVVEVLDATSQELSKTRKKRKAAPELANSEAIASYDVVADFPGLRSSSTTGLTCVDLHADQDRFVIGGVNKNIAVFSRSDESVRTTLKGHTKRIHSVKWHGSEDIILSSAADKTARIWRGSDSSYEIAHVVKAHKDEVTAVSLHPSSKYFATASLDATWGLHDIATGASYAHVSHDDAKEGYSCAQFHPDGLILGTGSNDNVVRIWDVKSQANVANFAGHTGKITSIAFSENGYYLATAAEDATVKLWDLRKLVDIKTASLPGSSIVRSLSFDYSGTYLALGGADIKVYHVKNWNEIVSLSGQSDVSGVVFGSNAQFIGSVSMDKSLKIFGAK